MRIKDIGWNIAGLSSPLIFAVVTIPGLVDKLGLEKFGLLALAWGLIGYAGALDLGIGRAVTQMISFAKGRHQFSEVIPLFRTGTKLSMITGLSASIILIVITLAGAAELIKSEQTPKSEIFFSLLIMALAMPAQAISATYKGVCEAEQKFRAINILRIALGIINFAGPFALSFLTQNLTALIGTLVVSRIFALYIYKEIADSVMEDYTGYNNRSFCRATAKRILKFGGWVTVSSILSPIMTQADRFVIAAVISASAVSVYVIPYDIVIQTLILVGAISTVAFPTLSKVISKHPNSWRPYFRKWTLITAIMMLVVLSIVFFSLPYILPFWLTENFDERSVYIGQVLCVGVLANSVASMYYALLHARGRADITAKIHLAELPFFIGSLYFLINCFGIIGVATACVLRMVVDLFLLVIASNYTLEVEKQ